jgi:hypothetical protein
MARIFTTPDGERAAKARMHDIMVAAGLTKNLRTYTPSAFNDSRFITAAQTICNELTERDFANIDPAIDRVSDYSFNTSYDGYGTNKRLKADAVAKCIVYMAELLQLYWDDTIRTPFEIDEFKKTLLGSAVYKYGRYISAIKDTGSKAKTTPNVSNSTISNAPGQPPKNNYKQSGPQSGNVRDLQDLNGGPGTPGNKVHGSSGLMFKIIGDNPQSKNTPNVFIKPLSPAGATGTTNKIFISSGNGYTDCTCYFDDPNEAQAFLDKIIADNRIPSNVSNMRIVKVKEDPNGYFLIGTEYGRCAVSAKTLNEALTEAIKNNENAPSWEKATEGYSKEELNELHAWMRRD